MSFWKRLGRSGLGLGCALLACCLPQTVLAQPANDDCSNAIVLTPSSSVNGDNTGATGFDQSSCAGTGDVGDVWYRMTLAGGGIVVFDTLGGATFDTSLSAFDSCNGTELACNDDSGGSLQSRISINFAAGQTVYIRFAGYNGAAGPFTLHVSAVQIPTGNDECANALVLAPGASVNGSNLGSSGTNLTSCAGDNDTADVWYRFTAAVGGTHAFDTLGTAGMDTSLGLFDACGGSQLACDDDGAGNLLSRVQYPLSAGQTVFVRVAGYNGATGLFTLNSRVPSSPAANDECSSAIAVASLPYSYAGDISGSNDDIDLSCNDAASTVTRNGVWFAYTPAATQLVRFSETSAGNVVIGVFSGACDSLSEQTCSDPEDFVYTLQAGTPYRILLGGFAAGGLPLGTPVAFSMSEVSPPTNDTCATARTIAASPYLDTVDVLTASNDVDVSCNATDNTESRYGVWYRFTAPEPGRIVLNDTSNNDVVTTVFSGDCNVGLTELFCSDAEPSLAFDVTSGSTYFIMVSLFSTIATPSAPVAFGLTFSAAPGACCIPTGCAVVGGSSACATLGGVWQGTGTVCGDPQARNDSPITVPDYTGGTPVPNTITVNVAEATIINDLNVLVNINHEYGGDLYIRLTGPNNATVDLFKRAGTAGCLPGQLAGNGGFNDFNGAYVFDDQASGTLHAALVAGPSPVPPGSYRPTTCADVQTNLNTAFAGVSAAGTWTLTVSDEDEGVEGTINSFGIIVNGGVNQPCSQSAAGACCSNAACLSLVSTSCTGPGRRFVGANTVCNVAGNVSTPCCRADTNQDGTVTIQDLFDFLVNWFAQAPGADADGVAGIGLEDLFSFLRGWFVRCM